MQWISELMKHITVSKSLTGAIFVTSATLVFGPTFLPEHIPSLPDSWEIPAIGVLIFTATLLTFWFIPPIWNYIHKIHRKITTNLLARNLTDAEINLISGLGTLADEQFDLRSVNYQRYDASKLELLALCKQLSNKGLIRINPFEENLIRLTEAGRERALKLQKISENTKVENRP